MSDPLPYPPITNSRLLPRNSTRFERIMADITDVPLINPIRTLWNPWTISAELLPYLAWSLGVDIWDEEWPELKKRKVVQDSIPLHSLKGTLPGIKAYMELADGKLIKAITPPQKTFLMPKLTNAEREAFLTMMPQLRTFLWRKTGVAKRGAYLINAFNTETTFRHRPFLAGQRRLYDDIDPNILVDDTGAPILWEYDPTDIPPYSGGAQQWSLLQEGSPPTATGTRWNALWPRQTDARLRWGPRVFYWDRGVEQDTHTITRTKIVDGRVAYDYDLTFLPGLNKYTIFPAHHEHSRLRKRFLVPADAVSRTFSTRTERAYTNAAERLNYNTVPLGEGLDPVDVTPHTIFQRGNNKGHGVFPGRHQGFTRDFLVHTTANERIYDRLYLHDPDRLPANRKRFTHLGHTRLGMAAFNAEIVAQVNGHRYVRAVGKYVTGYLHKSSLRPLNRTLTAIKLSKSARDKILVNTATRRKPRAGDRLRVGSIKLGQLVRK